MVIYYNYIPLLGIILINFIYNVEHNYIYMYVCMYVCMYIYICMYVCMYVYIYTLYKKVLEKWSRQGILWGTMRLIKLALLVAISQLIRDCLQEKFDT